MAAVIPDSEQPIAAGTIVAGYRIERLLGFGGMGAVYAAVHPIIGKRAAVKVIQTHAARVQSGVERFIQEARLVNQIHHPSIVDVFGFDSLPDGRPVLVMELLEGETLAALLHRRTRLPTEEAVSLLLPVLGALSAVHAAGVVHRDLKPENLFIVRGPEGRPLVKVLDFGIAKLLDAPPGAELTSGTGTQLGTPKYMSPEQCRLETIDGRSDVYALGLILYEMLAGRGPFAGGSAAEFFGQHLYAPPTPLSMFVLVDKRLEQLVMRMLAKDPEARPASTGAIERELREIIATFAVNATVAVQGGAVPQPSVAPQVVITAVSGAPIAASTPAGVTPAMTPAASPAVSGSQPHVSGAVEENRLCTVIFAEVSGLPTLAERMPPDEAKEIVDRCFSAMAQVIEREGGVVDKYLGDAVQAVFGVPRSMDNDAERAVHAALGMRAAVARFAKRERRLAKLHQAIDVRVGVSTGRVFAGWVGGSGRRDFTVLGEPVNASSRLCEIAPEGSVIVSRETYRQVTGLFQVEEMSPTQAKGRRDPLVPYRVTGMAPQRSTSPVDEFYGVATKFVGRKGDLDQLVDTLDQVAAERRAQLVTLVGPAGAGKSRLLDELGRVIEARSEPIFFLRGRGSHLSKDATYEVASSLLRARFHINVDDPASVVEQKLRNGVRAFGRAAPATSPTPTDAPAGERPSFPPRPSSMPMPDTGPRASFSGISALSSISGISAMPLADLDPSELGDSIEFLARMLGARASGSLTASGESVDDVRARMNASVARLLELVSARGPVVIQCDGLEAADDATLDMLDYLLARMPDAPLLVVCAARPDLFDRRPLWGEGKEGHARVTIDPLPRRALEELARDLLRRAPHVSADFLRRLVDRADGNPLVLKETLRVLVDVGAVKRAEGDVWQIDEERLESLALPPTVYGIVQARLDRLPPEARALLQRAAVVGRVFWEGSLEATGATTDLGVTRTLRDVLDRLRANDVLRARESSMFPDQREYAFADTVTREVAYESLSHRVRQQIHVQVARWLESRGAAVVEGNPALLAFHYDRGGLPREAITNYARAGGRAASLGHNADALRHFERACAIADSTKGAEMPEGSGQDFARFEELRVVDWRERAQLRLDLGDALRRLGRLDDAFRVYEEARAQVVRVERRNGVSWDPAKATRLDASVDFRLGQVERVRAAFDRALERFTAAREALGADGDPKMLAPLHAAIGFAQYRLGKLDEALSTSRAGLAVARRLKRGEPDWADAVSRVFLTMGAVFYHRKQLVRTERMYRIAQRVVDERRFPQLAALACNNLGAVYYQRGDFARARDTFRKSLQLKERVGDLYDMAVAYNNLADAELMLGETSSAMDKVGRALQLAEALAAGDLLPDAYRILSEALRARGDVVGSVLAAERAIRLALAPVGRPYLPSVAAVLRDAIAASHAARSTLDAKLVAALDEAFARVAADVPGALDGAEQGEQAQALRAVLGGASS